MMQEFHIHTSRGWVHFLINQPNQTYFSKECIHKNSSFTQSQILAEFVGGRGPGMTCFIIRIYKLWAEVTEREFPKP